MAEPFSGMHRPLVQFLFELLGARRMLEPSSVALGVFSDGVRFPQYGFLHPPDWQSN